MYTLVPNLWKKFQANLREKCSLEQSGTKKDGHFVVRRVKKIYRYFAAYVWTRRD